MAIDLETTGLSPADDRIVELGALRFLPTGEVVDSFSQLVNPLRLSSPRAQSIHKIPDEWLARAETADRALPPFIDFLGPSSNTLLAHHALFDAGFLGAELTRHDLPIPGHRVVDTLDLSRKCWPDLTSHRLDALSDRFGLDRTSEGEPHRALCDSWRVRELWLAIQRSGKLPEAQSVLAYPIHDGAGPRPAPLGHEEIKRAMESGREMWVEYDGGSRGPAPRPIAPRRFAFRGGFVYLVATCQLDLVEKEFRLDRLRAFKTPGAGG